MDDPTDTGAFAGWLHRVEPDGSTERVRDGIGISNALAFSPEGTVMYHADTLRDVIWAYDYDLDTGDRHNERVFADFAHLRGRPDGACVDADGCLWVAAVYGSAVLRLTPDGALDRTVELPVERPTMPAFGGVGLDTVFVTSIGEHRSTEFAGGTLDGAVFAFPAPRAGIPEPRFGG
jgi:sugar lactone lactonase YvrE